MKSLVVAAAAASLAAAAVALAQPPGPPPGAGPGAGPGPGPRPGMGPRMGPGMGPGTAPGMAGMDEYMRAMQPSMQAMMTARDRDADRAFALKMIEHHRGAMAMADVLQRTGRDRELQRMATRMRQDQQRDIRELQAWLDRHGGRAARP